jgi:hypothetical protein
MQDDDVPQKPEEMVVWIEEKAQGLFNSVKSIVMEVRCTPHVVPCLSSLCERFVLLHARVH